MAHFITSAQDHDHITPANDAVWDAGTIGHGKFAIKAYREDSPFACSMPDSNTLRIHKGQASCDGFRWEIEGDYEEVVIENGTPGYNRIDLVVADITTAPKMDCNILVLKGEETTGTPVAPSIVDGDLSDGDTHVQMLICEEELEGINPKPPVMKMDVLVPYKEAWDSLSQDVDALSEKSSRIVLGARVKNVSIMMDSNTAVLRVWDTSTGMHDFRSIN